MRRGGSIARVQETLFEALAAWRQAFLSYYHWLETRDPDAWTQWTAGRERFEIAEARHVARFARDNDFPAFDLTSAKQAITIARRGGWVRGVAAGLLIGVITVLVAGRSPAGRQSRGRRGAIARVGRVAGTAAATPWRLADEPADLRFSVAVTVLSLVLAAFLAAALAGFTTAWISAGAFLVICGVGLAVESTADGRETRGRLLVATVGSLIPGLILLLALVAFGGPLGFWHRFWSSPVFRVFVMSTLMATVLWTICAIAAARPEGGWSVRVGGLLAAAGAAVLSMTALLPDWTNALRFLDRPLNFAPATETMVIALRTYVGVSFEPGAIPWVCGAVLVTGGLVLSRRTRQTV